MLKNKLITKETEWIANMTEMNHLGAALIAKPHVMQSKINELFSARNIYADNPLTSFLEGSKITEEYISSTHWEWQVKDANVRPLMAVENLNPETNSKVCDGKSLGILKVEKNWWLPGDYVFPGGDKKYQARIMDVAKAHGDGYAYTIRLASDDPKAFIPSQYFEAGALWSKLYSMYGEATEQSGSTVFSFPISLMNSMSKYRKQYSITDYASTQVLAVKMPDSTGRLHDFWIRYAEVEYWLQWRRELERGLWYSRSTETVLDHNGRPVRSGAGIQEQLEDAPRQAYNTLTADLLEDFIMGVSYGRTKPGQNTLIKGYTGEYGMLNVHKAAVDAIDKGGFVKNIEEFTTKMNSPYHQNAYGYGYQFLRLHLANGRVFEVVHNPIYDDPEINTAIDEVTGKPLESQRITILNFSGEAVQNNIKIMKREKGDAFGYVEGLYGPYGPSKSGKMAHSGDYYEMHVRTDQGIHIEDVSRCGELFKG